MVTRTRAVKQKLSFKDIIESPEYKKYGRERIGLFVLQLLTGSDDLDHLAAEALVGQANDKKIDIFFNDLENHVAYIGQAYHSDTWGKAAAPANKAADLNAALTWSLSAKKLDRVPRSIRDRAYELRDLLSRGEITRIVIFYAHNCQESTNVEEELRAVGDTTRKLVSAGGNATATVIQMEYGVVRIQSLFASQTGRPYVDESITIKSNRAVFEETDNWTALVTSVEGEWLQRLYQQYAASLFSANFRSFLGISRRKRDINAGIQQTIESEPENFWAYNNGITILCESMKSDGRAFRIKGIAIVNGAQTTGSFGEADDPTNTKVLCRFIRCSKSALIDKIIKFNNTQNAIKPADVKAKDSVQVRLHDEFHKIGLNYLMRRTGVKSPHNAIWSSIASVALASFHGRVQTAARNSADIFLDDDVYGAVFTPSLSAQHVVVVLGLSNALDQFKRELKERVDADTARRVEEQNYEVLRYSMSKHFLMAVFGRLVEDILERKISDLHELRVSPDLRQPLDTVTSAWGDVIRAVLPLIAREVQELGQAYDVTRDVSKVEIVATRVSPLIDVTRDSQRKAIAKLRSLILPK